MIERLLKHNCILKIMQDKNDCNALMLIMMLDNGNRMIGWSIQSSTSSAETSVSDV